MPRIWGRRGRGRPPVSRRLSKDGKILESLARIVVMQEVDSSELFDGILKAWNNEEAECKQLRIRCREKKKDSAFFLFTKGQKVVAQFPIPTAILKGYDRIESYVRSLQSRRASSIKRYEGVQARIKDLKAGMKRVNLKVKVVEIPEPKMVYTRYGTTPMVSNILIKDETGSMRMSLWNHQINTIRENDEITIKNGKVSWFNGERHLNLGRSGSLRVIK